MHQSVTNLIKNKNNKRSCPKHRCHDDIWNIEFAHHNTDLNTNIHGRQYHLRIEDPFGDKKHEIKPYKKINF